MPVTRADITQCMREVVEAEDGPFQRFFAMNQDQIENQEQRVVGQDVALNPVCLHTWSNGLVKKVPEGFRFPSFSVAAMWHLWHFGNERQRICAPRTFSTFPFNG